MKKVAFITLGCRVNQYESVSLAESLAKMGYMVAKSGEEADLYVVNTCAVTAESARKSGQAVRKAASSGKPVCVLGCASQLQPDRFSKIEGVRFITGCGAKSKLLSYIESESKSPVFAVSDKVPDCFESLEVGNEQTDLFSSCRAYIKIQDGCNCFCSYCTIPFARGRSRNRDMVDIINEANRLASAGYKEIELTGIETSAYGNAPLCELIQRVGEIPGIRRIRLGSLSPVTVSQSFINTVKNTESFMPHLHISVQSGSGSVLKAMRRPYSAETLYEKLDMITNALPEFLLSVDLISGFPGESEENFVQTLSLVQKYRFSHVHAFPYSERAGTLAATMPGAIPVPVRKARNERLIALSNQIHREILQSRVGLTAEVLVEKRTANVCKGHTKDYLECVFTDTSSNVGDIVKVDITNEDGTALTRKERLK